MGQDDQYGHLQEEMIVKLRHRAFVDHLNARHEFQYLVLPSFEPPIAWDVFRRRHVDHEDNYVLVRSAWRCDLDLQRLRTQAEPLPHPSLFVPSLAVHQLDAPSGELARLAADLAALRPALGAPPSVYGFDGVTYELAIEQPPYGSPLAAKCRLSWWREPPPGWEGVAAWVQRAEAVFEAAWAARGPAAPVPLHIRIIDDAAARHEARRLFHTGQYGRAAELLAEVGTRERLTAAEELMLDLALERAGGSPDDGLASG